MTIALPARRILTPRFEFPAFLRNLKDDAVSKMRSPLGGAGQIGGALGVGRGAVVANWWEAGGATGCVVAYQPKGAASLAASYVNLANPGTYDAAPGVAPTFASATGWTFNGSTQYLNTGIVPVNNQTWSMFCQFSGIPGATAQMALAGLIDGPRFTLSVSVAGNVAIYQNGSYQSVSPSLQSGNLGMAGNKGYRNGTPEAGTIGASGGSFTNGITIAKTSEGLLLNAAIQALVIYNTTLSATQVTALAAAMAAL